MLNSKNIVLASLSAAALLTAGCSDKVSYKNTVSAPATVSGTVVDGYIKNANVTCGTMTAITNTAGNFSFPAACTEVMTADSGINVVSAAKEYPFMGKLKAEAGSTVITPLTTLLVEAKKVGLSEADVLALLDLDNTVNISKTDPMASSDLRLLQVTVAVQQIIQDITKSLFHSYNDENYEKTFTVFAKKLLSNRYIFLLNGSVERDVGPVAETVTALNADNKVNSGKLLDQISKRTQEIFSTTDKAELDSLLEVIQNPGKIKDGDFKDDTPTLAEKEFAGVDSDSVKIGEKSLSELGVTKKVKVEKEDGTTVEVEIIDVDGLKKKGTKIDKVGSDKGFKVELAPTIDKNLVYSGQKVDIAYQVVGYKTIEVELPAELNQNKEEQCSDDNQTAYTAYISGDDFKKLPSEQKAKEESKYKQYLAFCNEIDDVTTAEITIQKNMEILITDAVVDIKNGKVEVNKNHPEQKNAKAYVYAVAQEDISGEAKYIRTTIEDPIRRDIVKGDGNIEINYDELVKAIRKANEQTSSTDYKIDENELLNLTGDFLFTMAISDINFRQADGSEFESISVTLPNIKNGKTVNGFGIKNGKLTIEEP